MIFWGVQSLPFKDDVEISYFVDRFQVGTKCVPERRWFLK